MSRLELMLLYLRLKLSDLRDVRFILMIHSHRLSRGGEDKIHWAPSERGMFAVRSFYNVLVPHDNTPFSWKCICQKKIPSKRRSLLEQPPQGISLSWITLENNMSLQLNSDECVRGVESLWIIFYSIVRRSVHYKMLLSNVLVQFMLCLKMQQTFLLV